MYNIKLRYICVCIYISMINYIPNALYTGLKCIVQKNHLILCFYMRETVIVSYGIRRCTFLKVTPVGVDR